MDNLETHVGWLFVGVIHIYGFHPLKFIRTWFMVQHVAYQYNCLYSSAIWDDSNIS